MAVSRLFLYIKLTPVVQVCFCVHLMHALCAVSLYVLCVGVSLRHVQDVVCVLCRLLSVLCAGFSTCYVQSLVCVMCSR